MKIIKIDKNTYQDMNQDELNQELLNACIQGQLDIIQYLLTSPELQEHLDIHYQDNSYRNALIWACYQGHLDIVQYLLTSPDLQDHANIYHQDNYGKNALMYACINGHLNIVEYLLTSPNLAEHADIHHKDDTSWNALMVACHYEYLDIVKYLIIDMNMKIDENTMSWLQGKNDKKEAYTDILKFIESRNLYQKLDNFINIDTINTKRVKL